MDNFFILKDEKRRAACLAFITNTPLGHAVHIHPHKKNRSGQQNRFLWALYRAISDITGYTEDELHETCKVRFLGVEEKEVYGHKLIIPKSTAKLSTIEMNNYLAMVEAFAREAEASFIRPDDYSEIIGVK